ncbi:hypothetical protein L596_030308 [Steinernema carpocapsae]|uniref:Uncharacterized protein n=1 Tax=Steinernema carpocapsae TaxID=34508 RepID=A0A4U5LP06_STECR|nr:hypothetical protein L596_030308 [Steinernema carpocapsae]
MGAPICSPCMIHSTLRSGRHHLISSFPRIYSSATLRLIPSRPRFLALHSKRALLSSTIARRRVPRCHQRHIGHNSQPKRRRPISVSLAALQPARSLRFWRHRAVVVFARKEGGRSVSQPRRTR